MSESQPTLESAIYRGRVFHARHRPRPHRFEYPYFMLLLKADEIATVLDRFWQLGEGKLSWGRFRRDDYLGDPASPIEKSVKAKINELLSEAGEQPVAGDGDVFLLGHLRYLGFYFSPLNLYYLRQDGNFTYMLAEVSNTPWLEKHYYLVDLHKQSPCQKMFHVSPFNPMTQRYHWQVEAPGASGRCSVAITSFDEENQTEPVFQAAVNLQRLPLNQTELGRVLRATPAQTLSLVLGIYWQALKLFIKRTPLFKHPKRSALTAEEGRT